uniref:Formin-like protein n=1 Tax=Rhizophora mucronata TaxID=61149 RepID=A0A2P2LSU9_RHIMU
MQGSLWADSQKQENQSRAPEIDISELESLFSAASASDGANSKKAGGRRGSNVNKVEKVQLVDLRRAYNCEIMLTKIKVPLPDMINAVLALDSSSLDIDQVENLIKFCPTKEEIEMLKNYKGDKEMLGKCEQFFLELMRVPRIEAKLRVFAFRITFSSQVDDLRRNLNIINVATREVKESAKLRQIMQTILTLGNALNQGTARGSAVGFKLDSLLKLSDTRARNNKMTLMHYLCKLLAEKMPELLDFDKDLVHLEGASKIQLKALAEEMQAVSKGLEKVEQELTASDNDGAISSGFQKVLKNFLDTAEAEVRSLISLYSEVVSPLQALQLFISSMNCCLLVFVLNL